MPRSHQASPELRQSIAAFEARLQIVTKERHERAQQLAKSRVELANLRTRLVATTTVKRDSPGAVRAQRFEKELVEKARSLQRDVAEGATALQNLDHEIVMLRVNRHRTSSALHLRRAEELAGPESVSRLAAAGLVPVVTLAPVFAAR